MSVRRRASAVGRASLHEMMRARESARVSDKPDTLSPTQKIYGRATFSLLLPFLKPGFYHVKRALNSEPKVQVYFLSSGSNHPRDCCKVLLVSGRRSYTRDVSWEHPQEVFAGLPPAALGGDSPSPVPLPTAVLIPREDEGVWYESAPIPSRSPVPAQPSSAPSRAPPVPAQSSSAPSMTSLVPSRASPVASRPSPVPSLAPLMPSPMSSPSTSPPPLQQQQQQTTLSRGVPRELGDYFSGPVDEGEPQQLGQMRGPHAIRKVMGVGR